MKNYFLFAMLSLVLTISTQAQDSISIFSKQTSHHLLSKGFRNMTGFDWSISFAGPDDAGFSNNFLSPAFAITTVNGWQILPQLYTGGGLGFMWMPGEQVAGSPFFARILTEPIKKRLSPFAFVDIGYFQPWKKISSYSWGDDYKMNGFLYLAANAGVSIRTTSRVTLQIGLGYKYFGFSERTESNDIWFGSSRFNRARYLQRANFHVGISF